MFSDQNLTLNCSKTGGRLCGQYCAMRERFFGPEHSVLFFHRAIWFVFLRMFSGKEHRFHSCYVLLNIGHGLKRLIGPINCKWDLTAAITKIYIDGGGGQRRKD